MLTLLEGQISFGGMHDVLESVSRHKNVTNGVLRITSNHASGMIGIFCGRFLTGAVLILSGEEGYTALKRLLSAKDGNFAFMDLQGETMPDLRQSLGVDINLLLASVNFDQAELPLSEESLTGMRANPEDEVMLIDTSVDYGGEEPTESVQVERVDRINRTYDRLMAVSVHQASQTEATGWNDDPTRLRKHPDAQSPVSIASSTNDSIAHDSSSTQAAVQSEQRTNADHSPSKQPEFTKLKHWSNSSSKTITAVVFALIVIALLFLSLSQIKH